MFVLFYICENIDLIDGTLLKFFILFETSNFDDFDCILLCIEFIGGSVDFSIGALTNYLVECVVFDNSDHLIIKKNKK